MALWSVAKIQWSVANVLWTSLRNMYGYNGVWPVAKVFWSLATLATA